MNGDNYGAQRGWICYEKPKNTIILYYSQSVPKCAYDMKHHSIVEIVRTLWRRSSFLGQDFHYFFLNSLTVLGSQLVVLASKKRLKH